MLDLAVGTPVRITRNLGTLAGIVNGSTGRVFGFLYQNTPAVGHILLRPSAADAARDCLQLPIVLVKMDPKLYMGPPFVLGEPDVVPIPPVTQFRSLRVRFPLGHIGKVKRVGLPLRVAYASTVHAGQGITADTVIFVLSKIFARGLLYTVASRARTSAGFFTVQGPVQKEFTMADLTRFQAQHAGIAAEYARLRGAPAAEAARILATCRSQSSLWTWSIDPDVPVPGLTLPVGLPSGAVALIARVAAAVREAPRNTPEPPSVSLAAVSTVLGFRLPDTTGPLLAATYAQTTGAGEHSPHPNWKEWELRAGWTPDKHWLPRDVDALCRWLDAPAVAAPAYVGCVPVTAADLPAAPTWLQGLDGVLLWSTHTLLRIGLRRVPTVEGGAGGANPDVEWYSGQPTTELRLQFRAQAPPPLASAVLAHAAATVAAGTDVLLAFGFRWRRPRRLAEYDQKTHDAAMKRLCHRLHQCTTVLPVHVHGTAGGLFQPPWLPNRL
jgi:hypothetical protein